MALTEHERGRIRAEQLRRLRISGDPLTPGRLIRLSGGVMDYSTSSSDNILGVSDTISEAGIQYYKPKGTPDYVGIHHDGTPTAGNAVYAAADGKISSAGSVKVGVAVSMNSGSCAVLLD